MLMKCYVDGAKTHVKANQRLEEAKKREKQMELWSLIGLGFSLFAVLIVQMRVWVFLSSLATSPPAQWT